MGNNSRSILRRHLAQIHKVTLRRGTRWDSNPNRPKNDEERRQRMLESKRKSAQKLRARKKASIKSLVF
ncbi:10972_t:CDS:2 [Entrophospora sp. SA101]|nr:10972_t:CDS:2 [Entrophospora sp. SA101]